MWYTIKDSNDWLSKLAATYLGDPMLYPKIYEANKDVIADPDRVYGGEVIWIPIDDKPKPVAGPSSTSPSKSSNFKMDKNKIMIAGGASLGLIALVMLKK